MSVVAPAPPTGVLELVDSRWLSITSTPVVGAEVVSSVVALRRPGTLLQVYDPDGATTPPATAAAQQEGTAQRGTAHTRTAPPPDVVAPEASGGGRTLRPVVTAVAVASVAGAGAVLLGRRRGGPGHGAPPVPAPHGTRRRGRIPSA